MKKTTKVVLGSVMTMAMCASLITGSTLALFSIEDKINIAITSGKVDVTATLNDLTTYVPEIDETTGKIKRGDGNAIVYKETTEPGKFDVVGGSAELDAAAGKVTFTDFAPMDKVTFNIKIKNEGSINTKYQTKVEVTEGYALFSALDVKVNEELSEQGTTLSKWTALSVGADEVVVPVEIVFPEDASSEKAGLNCEIVISVMALQANADTEDPAEIDPAVGYTIQTPADFAVFTQKVNDGNDYAGKTIKLCGDLDLGEIQQGIGNAEHPFMGTIEGQNFTIKNTISRESLDSGEMLGTGTLQNVEGATIKNLTVQTTLLGEESYFEDAWNEDGKESVTMHAYKQADFATAFTVCNEKNPDKIILEDDIAVSTTHNDGLFGNTRAYKKQDFHKGDIAHRGVMRDLEVDLNEHTFTSTVNGGSMFYIGDLQLITEDFSGSIWGYESAPVSVEENMHITFKNGTLVQSGSVSLFQVEQLGGTATLSFEDITFSSDYAWSSYDGIIESQLHGKDTYYTYNGGDDWTEKTITDLLNVEFNRCSFNNSYFRFYSRIGDKDLAQVEGNGAVNVKVTNSQFQGTWKWNKTSSGVFEFTSHGCLTLDSCTIDLGTSGSTPIVNTVKASSDYIGLDDTHKVEITLKNITATAASGYKLVKSHASSYVTLKTEGTNTLNGASTSTWM